MLYAYMSVQVCVPMSLLQRLEEVLCVILHLFWLLLFCFDFCFVLFWFFCSETGFLTGPEAHSKFPRRLSSRAALKTYLAPLSDDGVTGAHGRVRLFTLAVVKSSLFLLTCLLPGSVPRNQLQFRHPVRTYSVPERKACTVWCTLRFIKQCNSMLPRDY